MECDSVRVVQSIAGLHEHVDELARRAATRPLKAHNLILKWRGVTTWEVRVCDIQVAIGPECKSRGLINSISRRDEFFNRVRCWIVSNDIVRPAPADIQLAVGAERHRPGKVKVD